MIKRFSLKQLLKMPTIDSGQFDNTKFDDGQHRILLSRMTRADGAMFDHLVDVQQKVGNNWQTVDRYRADREDGKYPKTRSQMVDYLKTHERYPTMNYNNQLFSYSMEIKVTGLTFPDRETRDRAFGLMGAEDREIYEGPNEVLSNFQGRYEDRYQIGTNGRSGGYYVLYTGGYEMRRYFNFVPEDPDDKRDYSDRTGWLTHAEAKARGIAYSSYRKVHTDSVGLDQDADFDDKEEWTLEELRERVALIKEFDYTCELAVMEFIEFAFNHEAIEEEVQFTRKVIVSQPRN